MRFFITDVFGSEKYSGNQLATFFDFGTLSKYEMQMIAKEINFSETTFITSKTENNQGFAVRIFTPESEIDFAGHPTLGTAYIICKYLDNTNRDLIRLNLKVGQISVKIDNGTLWMTQKQPEFGSNIDSKFISYMLGLDANEIDERYPLQEVSTGLPFTIVPIKTLDSIKKATINLSEYQRFTKLAWAKGIMIFSTEVYERYHDLSSRVFVNYLGIPEDPATGSATGCLAAYLLRNRFYNADKIELTVGQGYEIGRPSELKINATFDHDVYNIRIGGKVIEIAEGDWKTNTQANRWHSK